MAQESLDHRAAELRQVEAFCQQLGVIVERRGVDPFQRQHLARGAVPVHAGHTEIRIVLGVLGQLRQRGGLQPQIHFQPHGAGEGVHHFDQPQALRFG